MLNSLKIKNFRCFEEFELQQLGRVNLLVGRNNSGKTSILEAIHILDSVDINPFHEAIKRRKEYLENSKENDNIAMISHFCFGHNIMAIDEVSISGDTSSDSREFNLYFSHTFNLEKTDPPESNVIV
jgi:AAA15 family ATPase/GTPase